MSRLPLQLHTHHCRSHTQPASLGGISFSLSLFFSLTPQRDVKVQPGVKVRSKSPNSCLDSERSRPAPVRLRQRSSARCESTRSHSTFKESGTSSKPLKQPCPLLCVESNHVNVISGSVAGKPRPVSMPVVSSSGRCDPSLAHAGPPGQKGVPPPRLPVLQVVNLVLGVLSSPGVSWCCVVRRPRASAQIPQ